MNVSKYVHISNHIFCWTKTCYFLNFPGLFTLIWLWITHQGNARKYTDRKSTTHSNYLSQPRTPFICSVLAQLIFVVFCHYHSDCRVSAFFLDKCSSITRFEALDLNNYFAAPSFFGRCSCVYYLLYWFVGLTQKSTIFIPCT